MDYINSLQKIYRQMLAGNTLLTGERLDECYQAFRSRFGPEKLQSLDGEALLNTMFNHGNKASMVYWLEFKNDDEFPTNSFGGIGGGSALKFGIYRRKDDGRWITGSSRNIREASVEEAVSIARQKRDFLVKGAEIIAALPDNSGDDAYLRLQQDLDNSLEGFAEAAWVHKYYHLLFPGKISTFHSPDFQRFYLLKLLQKPASDRGRYTVDGQYLRLAGELNMPALCLAAVLQEFFGPVHGYWRVEAVEGSRSHWEEMRGGGFIALGWPALGNLRGIDCSTDAKARQQIRELLERHYPDAPAVTGKMANQFLMFVKYIRPGDLVVAAEGEGLAGIGRVVGEYEYRDGMEFPHCIAVQWLITERSRLPNPSEGLGTSVNRFRDFDNILAIERLLKETVSPEPDTGSTAAPLTGILARIEGILRRKKQVILYGPPGTGKTYWAERACLELAARKAFGRPFERLQEEERAFITGDGRTQGLVRICCFHPSYGYEDFIEGIKPAVINNQVVFELRPGIFKRLCDDARNDRERNYYLIIDEINRGDISRIFGELMMIIEAGKRGKQVLLPLSGRVFSVPENVYIVGTMNTADRSIALLDVALRRRFGFIELLPDCSLLEGVSIEGLPLALWLEELNRRIREYIGRDARNLQIGHAYFMDNGRVISEFDKLRRVLQEDVMPLLEEYCYGDYPAIAKIIGNGLVDVENQTIRHDLFHPSKKSELISALLETCPEITTSSVVQAGEDEEAGVDAGNGETAGDTGI